jgi:NAD(P)-dependent dehydrogenase (short-subunit alcohol dehydrogenase family)
MRELPVCPARETVVVSLILVTGASTGLGLATVAALLDADHDVVLHARSADRVEDASVLERVAGTTYADLSDLDATAALGQRLDQFGRFDAVIHNAGTMDRSLAVAVNVVAPYVLSAVMQPPGRSIVLSSGMHLSGSTDLAEGGSYSDSKLWATTLTMAFAGLLPATLWHAVDPGWVPTRMGGASATDDLAEGHRTQVWLASASEEDVDPRTAGYWHHHRTREPHPATSDTEFQQRLLADLEKRTGLRVERRD